MNDRVVKIAPVRKSLHVNAPVTHAFDVFTARKPARVRRNPSESASYARY